MVSVNNSTWLKLGAFVLYRIESSSCINWETGNSHLCIFTVLIDINKINNDT